MELKIEGVEVFIDGIEGFDVEFHTFLAISTDHTKILSEEINIEIEQVNSEGEIIYAGVALNKLQARYLLNFLRSFVEEEN